MSWEEYELMPWKLGWKHEYWDGRAHLTPRHAMVCATIDVAPRSVSPSARLRPIELDDRSALAAGFFEAFADSIDYCDWPRRGVRRAAVESIEGFFAALRGTPHPASRLATGHTRGGRGERIMGAALIVESIGGTPGLDVLFVAPGLRRRGLATALAAAALNALGDSGAKILESRYLLANQPSRSWHRAFGFVEEPDLTNAHLHWHHAEHELRRHAALHHLSESTAAALRRECAVWKLETERLQRLAESEGHEAASALLRRLNRRRPA